MAYYMSANNSEQVQTGHLTTTKVISAHFEITYAPRLVNDLRLAMENTDVDGSGVFTASAAAIVDEAFRPSRVAVEFAVEMLLGPDSVASAITLPGMRILPRKPSIWSGRYWMANEPALCASRGTTRSKSCAREKLLLLEELNGWNVSSAMVQLLEGERGRRASRLCRSMVDTPIEMMWSLCLTLPDNDG
jgi:hypothetical protein